HPKPNVPTVGRIHENSFLAPRLSQTVDGLGEIAAALGICLGCARVERERTKFLIQLIKNHLRRGPLIRPRGKVDGRRHGPWLPRFAACSRPPRTSCD